VPLTEAKIVVLADTEEVQNVFELVAAKKSYNFIASTDAERLSWIKDLKSCKKDIQRRQYEEQFGNKEEGQALLMKSMSSVTLQPAERERQLLEKEERKRHEDERKKLDEMQKKRLEEEARQRNEAEEKSKQERAKTTQLRKLSSKSRISTEFDELFSIIEDEKKKNTRPGANGHPTEMKVRGGDALDSMLDDLKDELSKLSE